MLNHENPHQSRQPALPPRPRRAGRLGSLGHPADRAVGFPALAEQPGRRARTPTGSLVLTDPGGTHVTTVRALGVVGQVVTASPDGRYLSLGNGQVAVVRTGPVLAAYPTKMSVSWEKIPAGPDSFADHERQL